MKLFCALLLVLSGAVSSAQETANTSSTNALLVNLGMASGGMALGADYEYGFHRTFGLGGYVRMYPDDVNSASINAFGAFIRPHFTRQAWDFYLSPGFGVAMYELGNTDETMMGPIMMLGLLYQFSGPMAFGIEQTTIYGWFGEETLKGPISDELLAKFRFSF